MAKGKLPMMPWFPKDYLSATRLMSLAERGAYCDLLFYEWEMGPLPNDTDKLARLILVTPEEFAPIWKAIRSKFAERDGMLINETLEEHRETAKRLNEGKVKGARITNAIRAEQRHAQLSLDEALSGTHPNPSPNPEEEKDKKTSPVDYLFGVWKDTYNHPGAKLDPGRTKKIQAALKMGYTLPELANAIRGYKFSKFHMGENDRHTVYDSLELFLRSAEHIDKGLQFFEEGKGGHNGGGGSDDPRQQGVNRGVHY